MAPSVGINSIVAAVDFSLWTEPVLETATSVASAYEATLTAVYAESFEPPPYFTRRGIGRLKEALEVQREEAERALAEVIAKTVRGRVKAGSALKEGAASDVVLRTAEEVGAGMIVLGTHGRTGLNRMVLGSVAEKVLRGSKVPVLTVRRPDGDSAACLLPFETILCPVNFTPVADEALRYAADLAARYGARLRTLTCAEGDREMDAERFRDQVGERISASGPNCSWTAEVKKGDPSATILQAARDWKADLLVIGAQHRPLLETTIFGTTSIRVTRHAACPVLTVVRGAEEG